MGLSARKGFTQLIHSKGRRVIGISGSLIWSKTLVELIFNPCGDFGEVRLLRSLEMLKREWGAESNGKLAAPIKSLVKLQPWFLRLQ